MDAGASNQALGVVNAATQSDTGPAPDIAGALKAGYTPAEIAQHLATKAGADYAGARAAGYSDTDIINHLVPQGNALTGAVEAGLHTVSAAGGKIAGDVAGLATIPANFVGLTDKGPQDVKNSVQNALTYAPRTQAGVNTTSATNTVLANTVGLPGRGAAWVAEQAGAGKYGQDIAQEVANQATGIVGAKVLPVAAKAAAPYVGAGLNTAANLAEKGAGLVEKAAKNKYIAGTASVDAAMTGLINPASIPAMATAAGALGGTYLGLKGAAPVLRYGANKLGYVAPGSQPLGSLAEASAPVASSAQQLSNLRSGGTALKSADQLWAEEQDANVPEYNPNETPLPPASPMPTRAQVMANALRQVPAATQQASTNANNAAAGATQGAVQAATVGAGRVTPTQATINAVTSKVLPLTQTQTDVAGALVKMGFKPAYAKTLVQKVDPGITDPAQVFAAALKQKGP